MNLYAYAMVLFQLSSRDPCRGKIERLEIVHVSLFCFVPCCLDAVLLTNRMSVGYIHAAKFQRLPSTRPIPK